MVKKRINKCWSINIIQKVLNVGAAAISAKLALTIDLITVGFMFNEIVVTHELGGYEGSDEYNQSWWFRVFYHYIYDWDDTIARIVIYGDSFDPFNVRFI
ncbi:MAG: hypothetical protein ACFFB5_16795 [Promethearchaeota archaeon]